MNLAGRVTAALSTLFGKAAVGTVTPADFGWYSVSDGPMLGSFQRDVPVHRHQVTANWAFFAAVTLIANDIGKLGLRLVEQAANTWQETASPAFSPVLRKPNSFQTRQQFIEQWVLSKLIHGNSYILKERDQRGIVVRLYVLNPRLVMPLVTERGEVFYRLNQDNLSGIPEDTDPVPASEIIHDRMNCLFHPLVGISPIYACGLAATQGLKIQQNATRFFQNMSRPSGILTSAAELSNDLAAEYRNRWNENYGGDKVGQVAVLGNGLSYQAITANAVDSQLIEQLKVTAEMICADLHVPSFKIGAGVIPAGQKVEDLNQIYYSDCLQSLMEAIENLLDDGLGLGDGLIAGRKLGTEFNLDDLLKMDSATMIDALNKAVGGGWMKPNEARAKRSMLPVKGGDTPYLQQQNFALAALAKRDALPNPFVLDKPTPNPTPSDTGPPVVADPAAKSAGERSAELEMIELLHTVMKGLQDA